MDTETEETTNTERDQKAERLKANGWYQYYSSTHWVHPNIERLYSKMGISYFIMNYKDHQVPLDEAYGIYLSSQQEEEESK